VPQHVVGFTFDGLRCRLFLNRWTHLPTLLEVTRDDSIWGDVVERRWFGFWTLEAGGLMYPRQTTTEWNGLPFMDETVQGLTVDGPIDETLFAIPAEAKAAFAANASAAVGMGSLTLDPSRAVALADWLVQLPGGFNVALVNQPDGVVIIEGTTSSGYSQAVIAEAEKRFPGRPIKAVVTTSDAWPHIAGMREYVARGTPIYALDLNVDILTRLASAPRTFSPDALARAPKRPDFRPVSDRVTIGSGETRMELIPVRGETGERMMLAWFPGLRTLYSSDLIQRNRPGSPTPFFMPSMVAEVVDAARREGLTDVQQAFGMHLPPMPWTTIVEAVAAAKK
jgi:glyoxylase-like metal-dependent hydrolase (beta-lactamase superfamily II)